MKIMRSLIKRTVSIAAAAACMLGGCRLNCVSELKGAVNAQSADDFLYNGFETGTDDWKGRGSASVSTDSRN